MLSTDFGLFGIIFILIWPKNIVFLIFFLLNSEVYDISSSSKCSCCVLCLGRRNQTTMSSYLLSRDKQFTKEHQKSSIRHLSSLIILGEWANIRLEECISIGYALAKPIALELFTKSRLVTK